MKEQTEKKRVSIVICTHENKRYNDLVEAIDSVKVQIYKNMEIVVVVDGNKELYNKVLKIKNEVDKIEIRVVSNKENLGLSKSRNNGIKEAHGDIIAFLDDDAIADRYWIKELIKMYDEKEAIAVGGLLLPKWTSKKPKFLPEEFYWLVGAMHKGFAEEVTEVRNTFGSNLSFKAEVLKALGGFKNEMGVKGTRQMQGEETELCDRMRKKFGKGVVYNPDAIVYHKVFPERLEIRFLLRRAFWQGYSKRVMKEEGCALHEENTFLKVVFNGIFERIGQILSLFIFTFTVMIGYLSKLLKRGVKNE